jgi:hypothetical protein
MSAATYPGTYNPGHMFISGTLLLPRGTEAGMHFRVVLLTDAAADRVPQPGGCGSMSFCGAAEPLPRRSRYWLPR